MSSLATFGVGFMVRPLGAVVFGILGDRVGRKYTFLATVTVMGVATACVGVLPTYTSAGIAAPLLLLLLRIAQGLALGGEYGGAAIYVAEHAPPAKRGFYTSFIQASVVGGFLLSLGVVLLVTVGLGKPAFRRLGLAHPVPGLAAAARAVALSPPEAERVAHFPGDEGQRARSRARPCRRRSARPATSAVWWWRCSASRRG